MEIRIMEMKEDLEEWRDIPEYEGLYQASSFGRVRSLPKEWVSGNGGIRNHNGKILKGSYHRGYYKIRLYKNCKQKNFTIHQLVAMAFLGHIPDGTHNKVVDHISNDKSNNRVDNLQLITSRENTSKDRVGSSKYCGVCWFKKASKWIAYIQINGQRIHLGYFHNEEEASQMYQLALSNIDKYNGNPKEFRDYLKRI